MLAAGSILVGACGNEPQGLSAPDTQAGSTIDAKTPAEREADSANYYGSPERKARVSADAKAFAARIETASEQGKLGERSFSPSDTPEPSKAGVEERGTWSHSLKRDGLITTVELSGLKDPEGRIVPGHSTDIYVSQWDTKGEKFVNYAKYTLAMQDESSRFEPPNLSVKTDKVDMYDLSPLSFGDDPPTAPSVDQIKLADEQAALETNTILALFRV